MCGVFTEHGGSGQLHTMTDTRYFYIYENQRWNPLSGQWKAAQVNEGPGEVSGGPDRVSGGPGRVRSVKVQVRSVEFQARPVEA